MTRVSLCPVLLVALYILAGAAGAQEAAPPSEKLAEGWRQEVKTSEGGDRVVAWVEKGWLQVRRQTAAGEMEWQVVLAKATDPTPPTIEGWPLAGSVNVSYAGGRYFVRDYLFYLRAFREMKDADDDTWPRLTLNANQYKSSGYATTSSGRWVTTWQDDAWFALALGPGKDASDCLVRLNHRELLEGGFGTQSTKDFARVFHGDMELFDEGDLLFCKRTSDAAAKAELAHRASKRS